MSSDGGRTSSGTDFIGSSGSRNDGDLFVIFNYTFLISSQLMLIPGDASSSLWIKLEISLYLIILLLLVY